MFRGIKRWTPTVILVAAIGYFCAHAMTGERGLVAWQGYKAQLAQLETDIAGVEAERAVLERRAARLRDASLDLDYLDERARALLAVGAPNDIVVPAAARVRAARENSEGGS